MADRPHILFNRKKQKYVRRIRIMEPDGQSMTVFTADRFTGPYTKMREHFHPLGMNSGEFDLAEDGEGHGCIYFEKVPAETGCTELSEDRTGVNEVYSFHFPHPEGPPAVRKVKTHFVRKGRHSLLIAGTTGCRPNPTEAAGDSFHGPFAPLPDP